MKGKEKIEIGIDKYRESGDPKKKLSESRDFNSNREEKVEMAIEK